MEYKDMTYTDNDRERLRENKKAICEWIMNNIIPKINSDDVLKIDFGGTYVSPNNGNQTEKYHFRVYGKTHGFYFMGYQGDGNIGYAIQFGGYQPFEKVSSPYDIHPIVDNWGMIKNKLLNQIEEHNRIKQKIYTFEV